MALRGKAQKPDLPAGRRGKAQQQVDGGGLACTIRAQETDYLTMADTEVKVFKGHHGAKHFVNIPDRYYVIQRNLSRSGLLI